ncbi:hypothetical protein GCM10009715_15480 [Paeniglutamicibacter psychrophenolicus]
MNSEITMTKVNRARRAGERTVKSETSARHWPTRVRHLAGAPDSAPARRAGSEKGGVPMCIARLQDLDIFGAEALPRKLPQ